MPHFLSRLLPPRKTFGLDMTVEERDVMRAHADYWLPHVGAATVIAIGPVADPAGIWGVAIVNAPSLAWLEAVQANDPAIRSARGFAYENFSMPTIQVAPMEPLAPVSSVSP
jgi:uncharacterized protein